MYQQLKHRMVRYRWQFSLGWFYIRKVPLPAHPQRNNVYGHLCKGLWLPCCCCCCKPSKILLCTPCCVHSSAMVALFTCYNPTGIDHTVKRTGGQDFKDHLPIQSASSALSSNPCLLSLCQQNSEYCSTNHSHIDI